MNRIIVPDTGVELHDGSIVILHRFPGTKWVVHNGWYTYLEQQFMGWYFCSIPAQTILPVSDDDLRMITVVSDSGWCPPSPTPPMPYPCPPSPCPCPPGPPVPPPLKPGPEFTFQNAYELDRAWISVDTIAQRDQLNTRLLPNGKIVRVNNDSGVAKYFIWNQVTQTWDDETFGINLTPYVTSEQLPDSVNQLLQESPAEDTISAIAASTVSESIEELQNQVNTLTQTLNWIQLQ